MTERHTSPTHAIRTLHQDVSLRPFIVIWEVTRACQLACVHCRADAQTRRDPWWCSPAAIPSNGTT